MDDHGDDIGALLDQFHRWLVYHWDTQFPDKAIVEAPLLLRTDALLKVRKIYSVSAHLEWFCKTKGTECSEVSAKAIKSEVTQNAFADKKQIVEIAMRCGLRPPAATQGREDACDAWGGWLIGLRHYDKKARAKWDQAIWSKRGFLL